MPPEQERAVVAVVAQVPLVAMVNLYHPTRAAMVETALNGPRHLAPIMAAAVVVQAFLPVRQRLLRAALAAAALVLPLFPVQTMAAA
jgi:hypothetical protein